MRWSNLYNYTLGTQFGRPCSTSLCGELLLSNFIDHPQAAGPVKNSKQWGIGTFSPL